MDNPFGAVILITVIDVLGFYPTFRKGYHFPHEELAISFFLSGSKYLLALFALENFTINTALYPFSLVVMNVLFVGMLLIRRKTIAADKSL